MSSPGRQLALAIDRLAAVERSGAARHATGLGGLQVRILDALSRRDDLTVGALARELNVRTPTVSASVTSLVDGGLATRTPRPGSRAVRLALTAHGRDVAARIAKRPDTLAATADALPPGLVGHALAALSAMVSELITRGAIDQQRMCATCAFFRPAPAPDRPHHCAFIGADLPAQDLRLDCPDHEPAPPATFARVREALVAVR